MNYDILRCQSVTFLSFDLIKYTQKVFLYSIQIATVHYKHEHLGEREEEREEEEEDYKHALLC